MLFIILRNQKKIKQSNYTLSSSLILKANFYTFTIYKIYRINTETLFFLLKLILIKSLLE